jgi:RNA polymerase sigma-70 factor (ECF subfamily)
MTVQDEDRVIIARIRAGDTEAFSVLVRRYSDALYRFCLLRLGNSDDAEDAVQDVFVRAYRFMDSFDTAKSFPSWLFGIAANRVRTRYARRMIETGLAGRVGQEAAVQQAINEFEASTETRVLESLASQELRVALARLPKAQRTPVELYYFAGLKTGDVASALGLGVEAVKTRLHRARKALAKILDSRPQPGGPSEGIY